jgi:hypothetical protein
MNTRTVDTRTLWAILAMEAALALPLMSLPTQGDRLIGLAGPVLLLLLLPAGFAAVSATHTLRDPSWRLLTGIGLALLTRAIVSEVPEAGLSGLFTWLARSFAPAAIGIGLWWRGGALAVAELTPTEVRNEFSVLAVCLVVVLSMIRPFLLPDPLLLGGSVGLFALGGLIGTALSRQDAAEVASPRSSRVLAAASGLVPAGAAVLLVGSLRPALLTTMWFTLARAIELALTPIGLLLAWLASLFPRGPVGPPPTPPPLPTQTPPDPAALAAAQSQMAWVATLIVYTLLVALGCAALLVARMLLANFISGPPARARSEQREDLVVETSGTPAAEAADVLGWLLGWLRAHLAARRRASHASRRDDVASVDAWSAYQRMLSWADRQGLGRRPAETTGQLSARLAAHAPDAARAVEVLTRVYENERYGAVVPKPDELRRLIAACGVLEARSVDDRRLVRMDDGGMYL